MFAPKKERTETKSGDKREKGKGTREGERRHICPWETKGCHLIEKSQTWLTHRQIAAYKGKRGSSCVRLSWFILIEHVNWGRKMGVFDCWTNCDSWILILCLG